MKMKRTFFVCGLDAFILHVGSDSTAMNAIQITMKGN